VILAQLERSIGERQLADVCALNENRCDPAILGPDRLIDEIQDTLFRKVGFRISEDDLHVAADIGLSGVADAIEQFEQSLALEFGQGLANRPADNLALTDQALVSGVGQLKNVTGFAEQGHETRSLLEHQRKKLMPRQVVLLTWTAVRRSRFGGGF
jgi:hypothetical protein